jgi:hypothetical protein
MVSAKVVRGKGGRVPMEDELTHEVLTAQGYRLIEDVWGARGRRTYLHEEDATRGHIMGLAESLRCIGWETDRNKLRSFRHGRADEIIEVEPGGSDTAAHFLHHMKAPLEEQGG